MSTFLPTSYNQAEYNRHTYNLTSLPQSGSVALFEGLVPSDSINGNSGTDLVDILRINDWIQTKLIKPTIWTTPSSGSTTWTPVPPSVTGEIWENIDPPIR